MYKDVRKDWVIAIIGTIGLVIALALFTHSLFSFDILVPYDRNGINKIHVMCDGKTGDISTQRYYGFKDYSVSTPLEFADLPIVSRLSCDQSSINFERRKDLLDRFSAKISCDGQFVGNETTTEGLVQFSCPKELLIEVRRR